MTTSDRSSATSFRVAQQWDDGLSWISDPDEMVRRASHAVRGDDDGVWLFDPVDAPGIDDAIAELGPVEGVAVLSAYHARDAGTFATRHDVPVSIPRWLPRVAERVDAAVERFSGEIGDSGFRVRRYEPIPGWSEAIAYRSSDDILYTPEVLGTAPLYTVGQERLGLYLPQRLFPPTSFTEYAPERILVGHGDGLSREATAALTDAVTNGRKRLPRAILKHGPTQFRAAIASMID
ncbi:hypothetical protein GL213_01455 [Halogeometricum borinquense]|uniref:MBL fold metallo-hydrolase n=1 Tax=Halogeometricum borinquense TaxID=60847 RepID=A0A6C0UQR5_9EURY|nr:hypothetical protein [Halogeometricum borinquense]QIB76239.1 hypothetical protein G3I44_19415 [Halogeometricum borinquense]QIQ75323.1 hypothetical protein GL213_01455 [Halogeometricum borinquense]